MDWNTRWAGRVSTMRRSTVRELLRVARRPGVISLAGGFPAPEQLPVAEIEVATTEVLRTRGEMALQYGETAGIEPLRAWIAQEATRATPEAPVSVDQVLIVSGSQQALDLLGRIFLEPGDIVAVENPTYLAALGAWRPWGVEFRELRVPAAAGEASAQEVEELSPGPGRVKLGYAIPNFQNPSGTTMTDAERCAWVDWARARETVLVEDDPYGALRFEGAPLPSLRARAPERTIQLGSFSKVLAPGLRVGWVIAPVPVVERLTLAKQSADLHTSTFAQEVVLALVRRGFLETHVPRLCDYYRVRRDALLAALERHFGEVATWSRPAGGLFVMVRLAPGTDSTALLARALEAGVAFVPGGEFHLHDQGRETLRLNFSLATPEQLEEGVRRLRWAFDARAGSEV